MPVRRSIPDKEGIYFITITCARWIKLFEIVNGYDIVYKWFDYLKERGHYINGYVIMPNHLHAVIAFKYTGKPINTIIGNGKRFMAYEIIERLRRLGKIELLEQLSSIVNTTDQRRGKHHEVFEPSFDWKECLDAKFIEQKLDYIHDNPCQQNWSLAKNPVDYIHSSAKYYLGDELGVYLVTSYAEMEDIDLTQV